MSITTNKLRIYYTHAFFLSLFISLSLYVLFSTFLPTIQQSLFIQMEYESGDTVLAFIQYARFKLNVCKRESKREHTKNIHFTFGLAGRYKIGNYALFFCFVCKYDVRLRNGEWLIFFVCQICSF